MRLTVNFASERDKRRLWSVLQSRKPKLYVIDIVEHREARSSSQNRYYFGCVLKTISQDTGAEVDDLHEIFSAKFLAPVEVVFKQTGERCLVRQSTARLDTAQFAEYIEKVKRFALVELDCLIPEPDQVNA